MGYFEGLTSGSFKTAQDGRRLFFPWGVLGRGYALASEESYRRLRAQVKAYMIVSLLLIIVAPSFFQGYAILAVLVVLLMTLYLAWMWYLLPRLEVANEGLSLQESMTSQAQAHGPVVLWLLNIVSLAFVACGFWMFIVMPDRRLVALAAIFFFGLCAAKASHMIVLRNRTAGIEP